MSKKRKPRAVSHEDQLGLAARLVHYAEAEGDPTVALPTGLARAVLDLAGRASKPSRGPKSLPRQIVIEDSLAVIRARARKRELLSEAKAKDIRLTADEAGLIAAKEQSSVSRLSDTQIFDRLSRRKRRR